MNKQKQFIMTVALLAVFFLAAPFFVNLTTRKVETKGNVAKNVIVLMMDGCGSTHTTLTRWYKGAPLALDSMVVGTVKTCNAESIITDSAPAATAFACGVKTSDKFVGILPDKVVTPGVNVPKEEDKCKPVASVLEGAKLVGKATGLVATSNIQHASPACFSSHWPDRNNYNEIAQQQVYEGIDVVLGAGRQYLLPKDQKGTRTDGEDMTKALVDMGYDIIGNRQQLADYNGNKVWGLFSENTLSYEFDRRKLNPSQPSLAQMTSKAIDILSKDEDGFFLFVEGSKIDWASHANDPVGVVSDVLAFDDAVNVALEYARKDGDTLVMAFADHGNGGMTIGNSTTNSTYSKLSLDQALGPIRKATLTGEGLQRVLSGSKDEAKIKEVLSKYYGINDLKDTELEDIKKGIENKYDLSYIIGPIISSRSAVGWTTTGHSGEDLTLYAYGPCKPAGLIENTDIAKTVASAFGFDLNYINGRLYQRADLLLEPKGMTVTIDKTDPENLALEVKSGDKTAILPVSKNICKIGATEHKLEGLVVYVSKTDKVFVPMQTLELLTEEGF